MASFDPADEKARRQRIAELKQRAQEAGGAMIEGSMADCPPELEESFYDYVAAYEEAPETTHLEQVMQTGLELAPADALDDRELSARLWRLIECLARLGVQLEDTDHLSDRELYTWLVEDGLTEETKDLAFLPGTVCHLSPIGGCSDEDTAIYLKCITPTRFPESRGMKNGQIFRCQHTNSRPTIAIATCSIRTIYFLTARRAHCRDG